MTKTKNAQESRAQTPLIIEFLSRACIYGRPCEAPPFMINSVSINLLLALATMTQTFCISTLSFPQLNFSPLFFSP